MKRKDEKGKRRIIIEINFINKFREIMIKKITWYDPELNDQNFDPNKW